MGLLDLMQRRREFGFTLMELLVVLTIIALLTGIALPLYTQFSQRSYRTEAQADLLNCAQALERWSAAHFTYLGAADEDGDEVADGAVSASGSGPLGLDVCRPNSVRQNRYTISVEATTNTFTLTATAPNNTVMHGDGDLSIDHTGRRTWDADDDGSIGANEDDWNEN